MIRWKVNIIKDDKAIGGSSAFGMMQQMKAHEELEREESAINKKVSASKKEEEDLPQSAKIKHIKKSTSTDSSLNECWGTLTKNIKREH